MMIGKFDECHNEIIKKKKQWEKCMNADECGCRLASVSYFRFMNEIVYCTHILIAQYDQYDMVNKLHMCTIFCIQCNLPIHCDDSEDNVAVDCVKTK